MFMKTYYQFDNLVDEIRAQHPTMKQFDTLQNMLIFDCRPLSTDWLLAGENKDYIRHDYLSDAMKHLKDAQLATLVEQAIETTRKYHRRGLTFKLIGVNARQTAGN